MEKKEQEHPKRALQYPQKLAVARIGFYLDQLERRFREIEAELLARR